MYVRTLQKLVHQRQAPHHFLTTESVLERPRAVSADAEVVVTQEPACSPLPADATSTYVHAYVYIILYILDHTYVSYALQRKHIVPFVFRKHLQ